MDHIQVTHGMKMEDCRKESGTRAASSAGDWGGNTPSVIFTVLVLRSSHVGGRDVPA